MIRITMLCTLLLLPLQAFAQKLLLNALYESQEKINTSNIDPVFEKDKNKAGTEKMNTSVSCTSDMQTSLPLRVVLGLLRGKGATLEPSYNANTNQMSIYGGPMIGNCNSMLEYHWGNPENGVPYTFEVRVKMPTGCTSDKCKYTVQTMKDEKVVDLDEEIEVAPTMEGFVECLEKTGVYKNGAINKDNIVTTEFNVEKNGVNKSGEVWFASRGPAAVNSDGGVFSKKNKKNNNKCYFYEDIQKDGYVVYTKEDIKTKNLMDEVANLCNSKNYAEIYGNLSNYQNFSSTYRDLEKVMQKQLLEEVAKAKKKFKKAVEKGDLSELDTDYYAKLFKDFNELIVQKQLDEDSHNNASDENNMDLLVNLYSAWENAEDEDEKTRLEKKIRDVQKKLNKYMEEPYFTLDDYKYFLSMKNKAPLKDPKWKEATITLHKSLLGLKLSCQAYSVNNSGCSFSDKSSNMKDMATIEDINDAVADYNAKAKSKYEQREYVLKNPDADNSEDFAELIEDCEDLFKEASQKQQYWMRTRGQYNMMAQQQCQNKNPYMNMFGGYGGYYTNKFKQCVEDMNYDYKMKYKVDSNQLKVCGDSIDVYKSEYSKWREIEDLRDKYYYESENDDTDVVAAKNSYNFNFTPGQMQQPNNGYRMPQQYNPYYGMQQNFQGGMFSNPYLNPNNTFLIGSQSGGTIGMRPGLSSGFNFGLGGAMGYGGYRNPAMYGGYGMTGMSAPMGGYMGNMSGPTGAYNFTYGM